MSDTERLDRIEALLERLLTAVGASQGIHSPEASGNTAGAVPAKSDDKKVPTDCADHTDTSLEHLTAVPEGNPVQPVGKSAQSATGQVDVPKHPLELTFWETILETVRLSTRQEFCCIVSDALREIRKQLNEEERKQFRC